MNFDLLHPADQIIMIMERIYNGGMTTTSGGNLSILDCEGNLWITPGGIDKGSLTRDDIMMISPDGVVHGPHKPSSELPFHQLLYRTRPDIHAVLHAHPPGLVAFSNIRKTPDTTLIPNMNQICGKVSVAEYDVPGSEALGEKIAKKFADGAHIAILENHGAVVGGSDLFKAFFAFETLEYCARLQIAATQIGTPRGLDDHKIALSAQKQDIELDSFIPNEHTPAENAARREICKLVRRAYEHQLFTSSQGTFSERISENEFIITPYGTDRAYLEPEDLVLIKNGMKEAGKNPSRSVNLHAEIYKRHPDINSVIIAHPSNIMAYAVTDVPFESSNIPESYIMLRDVPKLPFGSSFLQPGMTADVLCEHTPVVIVENDCVIVAGKTLINAYDRLEVGEFTAKSLIASTQIGEIIKISDDRLREIETAFNLK